MSLFTCRAPRDDRQYQKSYKFWGPRPSPPYPSDVDLTFRLLAARSCTMICSATPQVRRGSYAIDPVYEICAFGERASQHQSDYGSRQPLACRLQRQSSHSSSATISGDGVSPAASAAASRLPPGSDGATIAADCGLGRDGTGARRDAGSPASTAGVHTRRRGRRSAPRRRRTHMLLPHGRPSSRPFLKTATPGEHLVEHEAEGVDRRSRPMCRDRRPAARAPCRPASRPLSPSEHRAACSSTSASPKSVILHLAAAVEHDVGRLEVAMQHALVVRRRKSGAQLPRDLDALVLREPSNPPEQRSQILAVDVLHRRSAGPRPGRCRRRGRRWDATDGRRRTSVWKSLERCGSCREVARAGT